eukprot:CAMPEP_0203734682 /NCGR_PEP_ID=MMETSP0092-20131115/30597_1 /ASSEMBLY_ACC=CAM_ASM_001090 /TAXON_ID=426623 /ORGANISM="Chaetoceros affinis, Strain CCMP159" /LENGTH=85 /DNA_ID=CAMNT_0050619013 /DNA_START=43 /DNA_END=297 /DNA_ORIENTATION=+
MYQSSLDWRNLNGICWENEPIRGDVCWSGWRGLKKYVWAKYIQMKVSRKEQSDYAIFFEITRPSSSSSSSSSSSLSVTMMIIVFC